MDNIHTLDPRKQELLEARFITNRVSYWFTAIVYEIFLLFYVSEWVLGQLIFVYKLLIWIY